MTRHWWLAISLLSILSCSNRPEQPGSASKTDSPLSVRVEAAQSRRVEKAIDVTGTLRPDETVTMSAEVSGRVTAIRVDFGQAVRKGEVVAELDPQEFAIQLERSRAALAQAMARIGLGPGQEDVTPESTPAIRQAHAQLEDIGFKYENAQRLVKSGDISEERFIELEKAYRARQAALDAARDELRTQLALIRALRAEVRLAQKRLDDATVEAPFDGTVGEKLVSPGQYIRENTPIVTLVKTNPLRLRVEIPESAVTRVRVGTALTFTTDAAPGRRFHAVVRELNPSLDAKSRSLTAEARLTESHAALRPGAFVRVRLVTDPKAEIVVVPKAAVFRIAGLTKVFAVRAGRLVEYKIPPGLEIDDWVEAPPGMIRTGDPVVVSDLPLLVDGAPVQIGVSAEAKR